MEQKAKQAPKRLVFAEGSIPRSSAPHALASEGIAHPILLGRPDEIEAQTQELGLDYAPDAIDPNQSTKRSQYAEVFYQRRQRRGVTLSLAGDLLRQPNYFGSMMVDQGDADAFVSGVTYNYPEVLRPALQAVGRQENRWVSGVI